jgi:hypothetical protein
VNGKDFIICGLGESFQLADVDTIQQYYTIGVNDAARYCTMDHTLVMDRPECFRDGRREIIEGSTGDVWCFNDYRWNFPKASSINKFHLRNLREIKDAHDLMDLAKQKIFPKESTSAIPSIGLAIYLGARKGSRIGLLGVDLDEKKHHMGKNLKELDSAFDKLRDWLSRYSIHLVNLGAPHSKITTLVPISTDFLRKK